MIDTVIRALRYPRDEVQITRVFASMGSESPEFASALVKKALETAANEGSRRARARSFLEAHPVPPTLQCYDEFDVLSSEPRLLRRARIKRQGRVDLKIPQRRFPAARGT